MSLSKPDVNKLLNAQFICTWVNIATDPAAGTSRPHACTDGAREIARGLGEHNVQTLILTPDGRLLSALAGFIGPADLVEELKLARSLWEKVRKTPASSHKQLLEKAHTRFAQEFSERKNAGGLTGKEVDFIGQLKAVGPKRGVANHQLSARNPLVPADRFTTTAMVGNAKSAFISDVNGSPEALKLFEQFFGGNPHKKK